jgi:5'-3' exonuclease
MRTLIVDGTNLFIRSFSVDSTTDNNGVPIGGVSGTLKSLRNIIRTVKPQKVICVFDGEGGSIQKRRADPNYKSSRKSKGLIGKHYKFQDPKKAEENVSWQFRQLHDILECLPVTVIVTDGCEADDCIGYIAQNAEYFGSTISIIATCDKDFYQLINQKTFVYNPATRNIIDTKWTIENTGFHPNNWLFFKSINGDPSDNIKGVKGFGEKTIAKLFDVANEKELTIDVLQTKFEEEQKVPKSKLVDKYKLLNENIDTIKKNWKLMSLKGDVMMSVRQKDKITNHLNNSKPVLNKICFYKKLMSLGGIPLSGDFLVDFSALR